MGSTIGMGIFSLGEGIASYFANNIIGYASIFGSDDDAMGFVDNIGNSWSSLFHDGGALQWMNEKSDFKYDDDAYGFGIGLGHIVSVGGVRFLCSYIPVPVLGECLANAFTLGDGMGSGYRFARENGLDKDKSLLIGLGYGAVETLSFGFSGVKLNAGIGFSIPIAESFLETVSDPNLLSRDFATNLSIFASNYSNNGGIITSISSAGLYALNAKAHLIDNSNSGVNDINSILVKEFQENASSFERLKSGGTDVFKTPFVTTVFNYFLTCFEDFIGLNDMANDAV